MDITVEQFRRILENALSEVEDFDDDDLIKTETNTYFVKSSTYLATRDGFIDLKNIEVIEDDEDDEIVERLKRRNESRVINRLRRRR